MCQKKEKKKLVTFESIQRLTYIIKRIAVNANTALVLQAPRPDH